MIPKVTEKEQEIQKHSTEEIVEDQVKTKHIKNQELMESEEKLEESYNNHKVVEKNEEHEVAEVETPAVGDQQQLDNEKDFAKSTIVDQSEEGESTEVSSEFIKKYKVAKEEVKTATTTKIEATASSTNGAPKIPWRSSSKHVVKEKLAQRSSPSLNLVNVMISTAEPKTGGNIPYK